MLRRIAGKLFKDPDKIGFDNYLVQVMCFMALFTGFIATFINIFLDLGFWITFGTFVFTCLFGYNYLQIRREKHLYLSKYSTIILLIISINFEWVLNFGSLGPILYLFIVILSCIIFLFQKKVRWYFTTAIFINISILFFLEYRYPGFFGNYTNHVSRLIDLYTSTILYFILSILFLSIASGFYIRQKEKAEKADKLKSAFLTNITHEIRTPMNAILGFSQLLEQNISADKKKRYTKIIIENGEYLLHLIEDILDISKIEANQLEIHNEEFNVNELIDDVKQVISQYLIKIQKTHVELLGQIPAGNTLLHSDRDRIKQVLTNLLSNAAKFTDHGVIVLGFAELPESVEFFVEDSGSGIPKDKLEEIFERFNRIEATGEARYQRGTGIGLSISRQIIQLLGGQISVTSEVGSGSRFSFTIPKNYSKNPA